MADYVTDTQALIKFMMEKRSLTSNATRLFWRLIVVKISSSFLL